MGTAVDRTVWELHARIVRLVEAIEDGELSLAYTLACDLERDIEQLRYAA